MHTNHHHRLLLIGLVVGLLLTLLALLALPSRTGAATRQEASPRTAAVAGPMSAAAGVPGAAGAGTL